MQYYLVIDEGTTSVRCIAYDRKGKILKISQIEFDQIFPRPGYVEQDVRIILSCMDKAISEIVSFLGDDIISIGIANQRETAVLFRKDGTPIYNAISWQCRRTSNLCEDLRKKGYEEEIRKKTGLKLDPYFSATKIYWLLHNVPHALEEAFNGEILFGTIDTYLMYYLSQGSIFKSDVTNASRTLLFNIDERRWDKELCELFDIPMSMLPEVCPSHHLFGYTSKESVFKKEIPIYGVAGDQQSALFGHLCVEPGETKITYGTGCFILANLGKERMTDPNLVTTLGVQYSEKVDYVAEGSVFFGGSLVKWLRDNLGIIKDAKETETLALKVDSNLGVYVVPAFTGLGAPYWDSFARGSITGLTTGVDRCHIVRASLEAICYQVLDVFNLMPSVADYRLYVDGGASVNNFLMQFQSDILAKEVNRPLDIERTSRGIFYLLALNEYGSIEKLREINGEYSSFFPNMSAEERKRLVDGYHKAVKQVLTKGQS